MWAINMMAAANLGINCRCQPKVYLFVSYFHCNCHCHCCCHCYEHHHYHKMYLFGIVKIIIIVIAVIIIVIIKSKIKLENYFTLYIHVVWTIWVTSAKFKRIWDIFLGCGNGDGWLEKAHGKELEWSPQMYISHHQWLNLCHFHPFLQTVDCHLQLDEQ